MPGYFGYPHQNTPNLQVGKKKKDEEAKDKPKFTTPEFTNKDKEEPKAELKEDGNKEMNSGADETSKKKTRNDQSSGNRAKFSEVINIQHNQYIGPVD